MLQESGSLLYRPKDKRVHADKAHRNFIKPGGDHFTLLNIFEQWSEANYSQQWCYENYVQFKSLSRVRDIRDQLALLCERVEVVVEASKGGVEGVVPVQKAIASGYFYNTVSLSLTSRLSYHTYNNDWHCHLSMSPGVKADEIMQARIDRGGGYKTTKNNHSVFIHPSSCLIAMQPPPRFILYYELVLTSKEYMRQCMPIEGSWLAERECSPSFPSLLPLED